MKTIWQDVPWKDLETKGYLVIRDAFPLNETEELLLEFNSAKDVPYQTFQITNLSDRLLAKYSKKFSEVILPVVHSKTDIKADRLEQCAFFSTRKGVNFDWHIDHENYYISNDQYNFLNFYMPIKKPVREKSNLSILPLDVFLKQAPELYEKLIKGRGGLRLIQGSGKTVIVDDNDGAVYECNFSVKDFAMTPELGVGDLLVMRGDVFHKTQDNKTDRVNISFRIIFSKNIIRHDNFEPTCIFKAIFMEFSRNVYRLRRLTFEHAGKSTMPYSEHYERYSNLLRTHPRLPKVDEEESLLLSLGKAFKTMSTLKIVVIEDCSDPVTVSAIYDASNSFGAHLVIAHEKAAGLMATLEFVRVLEYVLVENLSRTLDMLKTFNLILIGLQGDAKGTLSQQHLSSHTALIVNGEHGYLTQKTIEKCTHVVCASLSYGRLLPLLPHINVASALMRLN